MVQEPIALAPDEIFVLVENEGVDIQTKLARFMLGERVAERLSVAGATMFNSLFGHVEQPLGPGSIRAASTAWTVRPPASRVPVQLDARYYLQPDDVAAAKIEEIRQWAAYDLLDAVHIGLREEAAGQDRPMGITAVRLTVRCGYEYRLALDINTGFVLGMGRAGFQYQVGAPVPLHPLRASAG
jgi:hypothetical protein